MNPCPFGFYADTQKPCSCAQVLVTKYQKRFSVSSLDLIDFLIEGPGVDYEKLRGARVGETSETIRRRVQAAGDIQNQRFSKNGSSKIVRNVDKRVGKIRHFYQVGVEGQSLIRTTMTQLNLSARAYHRILKLARLIANLARSEEIQSVHLAQALQYRPELMLTQLIFKRHTLAMSSS